MTRMYVFTIHHASVQNVIVPNTSECADQEGVKTAIISDREESTNKGILSGIHAWTQKMDCFAVSKGLMKGKISQGGGR